MALVVVAIAAVWFETNPNVNNRLSSIVLRSTLDVYLINVTFVNWASGEKRKQTKKNEYKKTKQKAAINGRNKATNELQKKNKLKLEQKEDEMY